MNNEPAGKENERVLSEKVLKKIYTEYVANDYEPIPEGSFDVDSSTFHNKTLARIMRQEVPNSFYGHRGVWRNINKSEVYTFPRIMKACAREVMEYVRFKTGFSPQGTDVPCGCDDAGIIIKPRGPAIITGSGVSLDKLMPLVKHWKGGLICSTNSQASTLIYHGAHPTHTLMFDSQLTMKKFENLPLNPRKTTIIMHPGMNPNITEMWKGQKYWYKIYTPNELAFSEITRSAFDFVHSTHYPFSCAISGQTAFAHSMGYDPLIFVGADFSFPKEQARFTEWNCTKNSLLLRLRKAMWSSGAIQWGNKWTKKEGLTAKEASKVTVLIKTNTGHLSHVLHIFYATTAMAVYWLDTPNIIDCSDGLLNGLLPKGNLGEIIRTQGKGLDHLCKTRDEIREWIAPWMASRGNFYIPMHNGHKLIETKNWAVEIPLVLKRMKEEDPDIDVSAVLAYCKEQIERGPSMAYGVNTIKAGEEVPREQVDMGAMEDFGGET